MKTYTINTADIKVRKTAPPPSSYHRDKKQEERHGSSKHPKKSFQSYMDQF